MEKKILEKDCKIATKDPRKDYELPVSTWPLRVFAGYVLKELNLVNSIGHTEIRNILLRYGIKYRQSKLTLCISTDPDHLKIRIEEQRYTTTPIISILLYMRIRK